MIHISANTVSNVGDRVREYIYGVQDSLDDGVLPNELSTNSIKQSLAGTCYLRPMELYSDG